MAKNLTLVLVLCLGCSLCLGDDGSARRYAEFAGHDDLFLASCLLEREDVQRELKITSEQIAKVKHIWNATNHEIPGLMELAARYRKRQSVPTLSISEKEKLREAMNSDVKSCINAYQRKELPAVLSANQSQRLGELLVQMRGPLALLDDLAISSKLQLSKKQRAEMGDIVKHYEAGLGWLRARYGRQQISGLHKNETQKDRQEELEALFVVIRAIETERDADLLVQLTPDQLAAWHKIQGKPFPIRWPQTSAPHSVNRHGVNRHGDAASLRLAGIDTGTQLVYGWRRLLLGPRPALGTHRVQQGIGTGLCAFPFAALGHRPTVVQVRLRVSMASSM